MGREEKRLNGEGSIYQRADGKYAGSITIGFDGNGKQKRRVVYGKTKAEVQKKLDQLKVEHHTGKLIDKNTTTVAQYLKQWLTAKQHSLSPKTLHLYQNLITHINTHIGQRQLQKLTPLHVSQAINSIIENSGNTRKNRETKTTSGPPENPGAATGAKALTLLKAALEQAVQWKLITTNPANHIPKPKITKQLPQVWEPEQIKQFLQAALSDRTYPIFYLAFTTGMRRGELLGLRWKDYDGKTITVRQAIVLVGNTIQTSHPKSEASGRLIPLPPDTIQIIEQQRQVQTALKTQTLQSGKPWEENDLIFTTDSGKPIHPRNLERSWHRITQQAGLPAIRIHDIRHTFASLAISQGIDVKRLSDVLGHASTQMTLNIYSHLFAKARHTSILNLPAMLGQTTPQDHTSLN